ncbi:MAG: diguanylate cyclase [Herbinix sp.]|jgi:diguanylate cyclase|nr:diguanylate cyclase [Herbinix sp.]
MLQELFINACILITVIFITSQLFRNSGIGTNSPIQHRAFLGILGGFATCILIYFSINVTSEIILDFRDICLILVAIFGGTFSTLIAGLIAALFRLTYNGINETSIITSIGILVVSLGLGILSAYLHDIILKRKILLLYSLLVRSVVLCIIFEDKRHAIPVVIVIWISTIVIGLGVNYLVKDLVDTHKLLKNLKRESSHDYLTGLSNTRQFDRKYKQLLMDAMQTGRKLSLFIIDIDYFKKINDTYGHPAGDAVLKELGRLLKSINPDYYLVSRIGGEEFAVVYKDIPKEKAKQIAERIRASVEAQLFTLPNNKKIKITISLGAAVYPDTVNNINELRDIADKKLYEAKWAGRNRVCI